MDAVQRKSPSNDFIDASPPHFSYDFGTDPTTGNGFEFANYVYGSPRMDFASLTLSQSQSHAPFFNAPPSIFTANHNRNAGNSPPTSLPHTPLEGIAPPLTYPQPASGSDLESMDDGPGSGSNSPGAGRAAAQHPSRGAHRYNPVPPRPTRPAAKRSATATRRNLRREEDDMSDDDCDAVSEDPSLALDVNGNVPTAEVIGRRREEIRRQRIESEQRRRDELREGYAKLKHTLPVSNQKSSKVSLLDRAVTYIRQLEASQTALNTRLNTAEEELKRQRDVNENLMRTLTEQHRAVGVLAAAHAATSTSALSESPSLEGSKKAKRQSL